MKGAKRDLAVLTASLVITALVATTELSRAARGGPVTGSVLDTSSLPADDEFATTRGLRRGMLILAFRTDCPVCSAQKPEWIRFAKIAARKHVDAYGVTPEKRDSATVSYFGGHPVRIVHPKDASATFEVLSTSAVPTTIFVDANGIVRFHQVGRVGKARAFLLVRLLKRHRLSEQNAN